MSDVSALMDKLKATVSYKQFDAPRAGDLAWPVLEKMARAKSALSQPTSQVMAAPAPVPLAPAPLAPVTPPPVTAAPVAAPTGWIAPANAPLAAAPAAPPVATPVATDILVSQAPAEGSLFERLQADATPTKAAAFSRYGAAQPAQDAPQALSEIFERIGRKAL
ncbi:hypothetical protein [Caulobacter segnis]|uniref:hypothetical protein n=1 Tax=Caulobacter segnis TaxID=88688 RepID=UPI00285C8AA2|nr:hypothetical protein [Caulobacter segnis]MDR6624062.1 hypothetical protein [Caulobacter segnis]